MKINRWTLIKPIDKRYVFCKCECGTEKPVRLDHLASGASSSCGCLGREHARKSLTTHGKSQTRVFKIWMGMIDRCRNDRSGNYGKRGIIVCDRWLTFENFLQDMGEPPSSKHSIDRLDVNGNYEPTNCRWASRTEQARNTRANTLLEFKGQRKTIAEWAEVTGLKPSTICVRLYQLNWPIDRILTKPAAQNRLPLDIRAAIKSDWLQTKASYREIARRHGTSHHAVRRILLEGQLICN